MDILAIIPARGGSKGVPNKNKKLLNGKPLIKYTFDEVKKSKYINRIILSSDDEEILDLGKAHSIEVPFKRPIHLANDSSKTKSVVKHLLNWLSKHENYIPEKIMILQPTSPFRNVNHIDGIIEEMLRIGEKCESIVSITEVPHNFNPDSLYIISEKDLLINNSDEKIFNRQCKQIFYARNGAAIYLCNTSYFLKHKRLFGANTYGYKMSKLDSIDIDDHEDFIIAESLLKFYFEE